MNYADLKALILSIPEAATLFAAGRDADVAALLNVRNQRGPVPMEELERWSFDLGVYGRAKAVIAIGPGATAETQGLYGLCVQFIDMLSKLPDVNIDNPSFQTGLATFKALGWIATETEAVVNALGANRRSVAQAQLGRNVTAADIAISDGRTASPLASLVAEINRYDVGSWGFTTPQIVGKLTSLDTFFADNATALATIFGGLNPRQKLLLLSLAAANRIGGE